MSFSDAFKVGICVGLVFMFYIGFCKANSDR